MKISKAKFIIVGLIISYTLLWVITENFGIPIIKQRFIDSRELASITEVSNYSDLSYSYGLAYYFSSYAMMPCVLLVEYGYVCGPVCGQGGSGLILWIPGVNKVFPIASITHWSQ